MTRKPKGVVTELIERALRELSDAEFQRRVWLGGGVSEMSSMSEAAEALFSDSGLGQALEKNGETFSREIDGKFVSAFVRATKPTSVEKGSCCTGPECTGLPCCD